MRAEWALLLIALAACRAGGDFEGRSKAVMSQTVPNGATLVQGLAVSRTAGHASASWTFESKMAWSDYSRWAQSALSSDYQALPIQDGALHFSGHAGGDTYDLLLEREPGGPPIRVCATFSGMPD